MCKPITIILSVLVLAPACVAEVDATEDDPAASEPEGSGQAASQEHVDVAASAFSRTDAYFRMAYRGGSGGGWYDVACDYNKVAIGIYGRSGSYVDQVGLVCAPLKENGDLGPYSTSATAGGLGGGPFYTLCPDGQALVGLQGRSGSYVDQLGIQCAPVSAWSRCGTVQSTYYAGGGRGGVAFTDTCPKGYALTSISGRSGAYADAIQGVCTYLQP